MAQPLLCLVSFSFAYLHALRLGPELWGSCHIFHWDNMSGNFNLQHVISETTGEVRNIFTHRQLYGRAHIRLGLVTIATKRESSGWNSDDVEEEERWNWYSHRVNNRIHRHNGFRLCWHDYHSSSSLSVWQPPPPLVSLELTWLVAMVTEPPLIWVHVYDCLYLVCVAELEAERTVACCFLPVRLLHYYSSAYIPPPSYWPPAAFIFVTTFLCFFFPDAAL